MGFYDVLDKVVDLLRQRGRVTYHALKREFNLDDDLLEDLKEELLYSRSEIVDDQGRGLLWTSDSTEPEPDVRCGTEAERRFHTLIRAVMWMLQHERRLTYRELKYVFSLDDTLLEEIRQELVLKRVALDTEDKVLVWMGETQPTVQPIAASPPPPAIAEPTMVPSPSARTRSPLVTEPHTPSNRPTVSPEATSIDNKSTTPSEPTQSAHEAERRQVTVMFADISGFTAMSESMDPEAVRNVMNGCFARLVPIVEAYQGTVDKFIGDEIMALFGAPISHERDAEHAVRAAMEMMDALIAFNADNDTDLGLHCGINTGLVIAGGIGTEERQDYSVMGDAVNLAARLEDASERGEIFVGPETYRLTQTVFMFEPLEPMVLKGKAEPVQVYRVLGLREVEHDTEDTPTGGFETLVGRDEEIGLLLRRWEQSKEGFGQAVLISGEAGMGKSSLVEGLRQHVRQEGVTCLTFRCSEYVQQSALFPVIEHLHRALGWQREDTAETRLAKLEQVLEPSNLPADETVPLLAALLSLSLPEGRYPPLTLSSQQQRQQTQDVLVALLLEEAERQPVLVVWEDLHWADPSTRELLGLFIDQVPTVPMLNVLAYRPTFVPPWPSQSHMTPMTLNRLERPQVEALITRVAMGKALPPNVVVHIVAKTDGVPLYVEEFTKMLLESDLLHEATDGYTLTGSLAEAAIPSTLQDSLMARLDRLPTLREVAQLGAVLGREFAYEMLQALAAVEEPTLQEGLSRLVGTALLYQRGRPPRATYIFRHALIRDTAYQSMLRRTRQQYHEQVAQLLEARFPEVVEEQPELVAHHYTEADCSEQAIVYWQQAGQQAARRSANQEAVSHLTTGLGLLATRPETPERTQQELDLYMALGPVLMATRGVGASEVEQAYTRARELCQQLGETPQLFPALRGLWRLYNTVGRLPTAREVGDQLLTLAQRQHDATRLMVAHVSLGITLVYMGEFTLTCTHLEQGLALTDPDAQRTLTARYGTSPRVECLYYGALALWCLGAPDQALQRSQAACTLARELGHPLSLAMALYWAARIHVLRGEAHAAQNQAEAAIALCTEHALPQFLAMGRFTLGWALAAQGQGDEGVTLMRQGVTDGLATGTRVAPPSLLPVLAEVSSKLGQIDAGLPMVTEALELAEQTGVRWYEAETYRIKGALLPHQAVPDAVQAEACFQQALDIAHRQEAKSWELRAATSLARLWQSQGKRQDAYDLLAPVYGWFTEGFDTADLQEAKTLLQELG